MMRLGCNACSAALRSSVAAVGARGPATHLPSVAAMTGEPAMMWTRFMSKDSRGKKKPQAKDQFGEARGGEEGGGGLVAEHESALPVLRFR